MPIAIDSTYSTIAWSAQPPWPPFSSPLTQQAPAHSALGWFVSDSCPKSSDFSIHETQRLAFSPVIWPCEPCWISIDLLRLSNPWTYDSVRRSRIAFIWCLEQSFAGLVESLWRFDGAQIPGRSDIFWCARLLRQCAAPFQSGAMPSPTHAHNSAPEPLRSVQPFVLSPLSVSRLSTPQLWAD
jgi:hypothetical protein